MTSLQIETVSPEGFTPPSIIIDGSNDQQAAEQVFPEGEGKKFGVHQQPGSPARQPRLCPSPFARTHHDLPFTVYCFLESSDRSARSLLA